MEMCLLKNKMSGIGGYSAPLKDSGNVAVTLTLSSAAAEDICGVLSALAELLKIPIPASFEIVERTATPPSQKLGLYRRCMYIYFLEFSIYYYHAVSITYYFIITLLY